MKNINFGKICSKCERDMTVRGDVTLNKATGMCYGCRIDNFPEHIHGDQYKKYYIALGKKLSKK